MSFTIGKLPFKRVISWKPWGEETGLTTKLWINEVPISVVKFEDLYLTQNGIYVEALFGVWPPASRDKYPHVILFEGNLLLEDGHTKVVRAALLGETEMEMRVYEFHP